MNTQIATTNSNHSDTDLNVQLRDLVEPLAFAHHANAFSKFSTFVKKLNVSPNEIHLLLKSDIYTDAKTWRVVDTFIMTRMCAMSFANFVDPMRGMRLMEQMMQISAEPTPIPYWTEKNLNVRLLAERYNRSISSVNITRKRDAKRIEAIGGSELHTEIRDGEVWFTEAYASCLGFTGEAAVQAKARAMVAYSDNPQLSADKIQRLLITTTKESNK